MRVIGLVGWSGAGKTTLLVRLLPALIARGQLVSTVKHAHHNFDLDRPGSASWRFRDAGAREVAVAAAERWALLRERRDAAEPRLPDLLKQLRPVDLVLVEGFKYEAHPRLEVWRRANGKSLLYQDDPAIRALAADVAFPGLPIPWLHLDDVEAIAEMVLICARPVEEIAWRADAAGAERRAD